MRQEADAHFVTLYPVCIERVERLAVFVEDIVGDVHHVVDAAHADGLQSLLQPLWRRRNLDAANANAHVARTGFFIFYNDFNLLLGATLNHRHSRHLYCPFFTRLMIGEIGDNIPRDAGMRVGVRSIWRQPDVYCVVSSRYPEIVFCSCSHNGIGGQNQDTGVAFTEADLIFGTDHAFAFLAADFCFFYEERLAFRRVNGGTDDSHHHLLTGSYIGRAANDMQSITAAGTDGGYLQLVGIRVRRAGKYFADH